MTTAPVVPVISPAEGRAALRRLRLRGATVYACRHCRHPVRVVSAAYLPTACPDCGRSTWRADGRCAMSAGCPGTRDPGLRGAHCRHCGESIWRRLGRA